MILRSLSKMPIFLSSDIHTCPVHSGLMGHPLQAACKEPVPAASAASLDQIASFKIYRLSNRDNHFALQKPAHGIVRRAHIFDWIQQGFKHDYTHVLLSDFCFLWQKQEVNWKCCVVSWLYSYLRNQILGLCCILLSLISCHPTAITAFQMHKI